jgi:hypothetical protein
MRQGCMQIKQKTNSALLSTSFTSEKESSNMISLYTGAPDAMCPITLTYVHELRHPVAFASDPSQPYELAPLWEWVLASHRQPLTGQACAVGDIVALDYSSKARDTAAVLKKAKKTQEFKQELKEIKGELDKLNENLERVSMDLDKAKVEKFKLELKIKQMENKFFDKEKTKNTCVVC